MLEKGIQQILDLDGCNLTSLKVGMKLVYVPQQIAQNNKNTLNLIFYRFLKSCDIFSS